MFFFQESLVVVGEDVFGQVLELYLRRRGGRSWSYPPGNHFNWRGNNFCLSVIPGDVWWLVSYEKDDSNSISWEPSRNGESVTAVSEICLSLEYFFKRKEGKKMIFLMENKTNRDTTNTIVHRGILEFETHPLIIKTKQHWSELKHAKKKNFTHHVHIRNHRLWNNMTIFVPPTFHRWKALNDFPGNSCKKTRWIKKYGPLDKPVREVFETK